MADRSGSAAAVRFKKHRIEIDALRVASGDQQIEANGVLGSNTEGCASTLKTSTLRSINCCSASNAWLAGSMLT